MINPMDLTGSVVMVTGASAGIGQCSARLLSQLGAKVVLVGRNANSLAATQASLEGEGHISVPFDLAKAEEIESWFKGIIAQTGPLTGLLHCAGSQLLRPLKLASLTETEALLRVNVTSGLMLAKAFRQKPHRTAASSMIFVSSVMGQVGAAGRVAYCTSKASLVGMTKALALELAPEGIRVNCIAPGFVNTGMLAETEQMLGVERFAAVRAMHPLGIGEPLDVANAAAFLLSSSSRWITGTTLVVDGGYTAH